MHKFTSVGFWDDKRRSKRIWHFTADQMPAGMWEPNDLNGQVVSIDSKQGKVIGVESFCVGRSPSHPYKLSFGLMVDDLQEP